jgi:hypothetical protein
VRRNTKPRNFYLILFAKEFHAMASIVLNAASAATAASTGGLGAAIAGTALRAASQSLSAQLFARPSKRHIEGARLEDLAVQTSTYGRAIAQLYGTVRLAGNVIWSQPIRETANTTTVRSSGGKGGRSRRTQSVTSQTTYSYSVTLAIAIAEGPIDRIERVWADAKLLDLSFGSYRIHHGSETQLPDPLIESMEGVGRTPAYRGLAYVVIEDFPLADFGNRIPNFSFEVTRHVVQRDLNNAPIEEAITAVILLPGSGEYVYDTIVQRKQDGVTQGADFLPQGYRAVINQHTHQGKADALVAIDQMLETFPNLEWVGLVVNWFATSLDTANCEIFPCVEYQTNTQVTPNAWSVAGYTRSTARRISYDNDAPRYGGTPDDGSLLRLIDALKARGLNVFFYPLLLVDTADKPWRGRITGTTLGSFFTRTNGYNRFITHYANLVAGKVDAFAIGSEMKALTAMNDGSGNFPAVSALVSLAASVKAILGSSVKVTYAADWSEYHSSNGWYNLDALWASPNIDVVGIDAYFPLTDAPQSDITRQTIVDGWTSGEGYSWYYTDAARTSKANLAAAYAWKDIAWWWNNTHTNPNNSSTAWVPQSKPIWFTEFGFASVDGCSNQPNVFVDPTSTENGYPRFSKQRIDFSAQREAIAATEQAWGSSGMVTRRFLWAWDARPYPAWPDLRDVWADGGNWATGHWVQGKLGTSGIAALVRELLLKAGLEDTQIDVSELRGHVDGFILHQRQTIRALLDQLQLAFGFDLVEQNGMLKALPRGNITVATVASDALLQTEPNTPRLAVERQFEASLPRRIEVRYLDRLNDYNTQLQASTREVTQAQDTETISLSMVLSEPAARMIADMRLHERWQNRLMAEFHLPVAYAHLEVGDVVMLQQGALSYRLKLTQIHFGKPGMLRIRGEAEESETFDHYLPPVVSYRVTAYKEVAPTLVEYLDIPALPGDRADDVLLRAALTGASDNWPGALIMREDATSNVPVVVGRSNLASVIGRTTSVLGNGVAQVFDRVASVDVLLQGEGELFNASEAAVLNGANTALIGNEIIQFTTALLLAPGAYRLSGLLRGRLGTEYAIGTHALGERFVLLNDTLAEIAMQESDIGRAITLTSVTAGVAEEDGNSAAVSYQANSLRPYAPVHLRGSRDSAGNLTVTWVRRARINAEWRDKVDVALDEATEQYEVQAWHLGVLRRTWQPATTNVTYSAAEQNTDMGSLPAALTFKICQISARVGAGYMAEATI